MGERKACRHLMGRGHLPQADWAEGLPNACYLPGVPPLGLEGSSLSLWSPGLCRACGLGSTFCHTQGAGYEEVRE